MNPFPLKLDFRLLCFLFAWCLFLAIHPQWVAAQSISSGDVCVTDDCGVEAASDMATNGTEIDTSSTIDNFDDEDVDSVSVEGDLYDNTSNSLLQSDDDTEDDVAEADLSTSVNAPHEYELDTYTAVCIDDGEGDCDDEDGPDFYLLIDTDYPIVSSISPTSITVGTSGTITVNGQNFIDYFGDYPTPFINNSGVTLSLSGTPTDTQATVNYSVTTGAATGDFGLNLKGLFGNGEPATLAVGDPTPTVTSVSPSVWYAGNSYTVTITGTNFGTNPTSSISAAPGVTYTQTAGSDTSITASVNVAPNAPNTDPITVTVTSEGFGGGSGFFSGNGQSPTTSTTAQAVAAAPPAPVINMLNGTTASPLAGQQISLSVSAPNGWTGLANPSWTYGNANDLVGGYNASLASGAVVPAPATSTTNLSYYYIVPDQQETISVTATYTLADGSTSARSAPATQTFNVGGPTGVSVTVGIAVPAVNILAPPITAGGGNPINVPILINGKSGTAGRTFTASATNLPAGGTYQWVQTVNYDNYSHIASNGRFQNVPAIPGQRELDKSYPYEVVSTTNIQNDTAKDSPFIQLVSIYGEYARSFQATMYLMWVPSAAGQCSNGNTCIVPIPLGSTTWGWDGDAINTLQPEAGTTVPYVLWDLNCGTPNEDSFQPGRSYPIWSSADNAN